MFDENEIDVIFGDESAQLKTIDECIAEMRVAVRTVRTLRKTVDVGYYTGITENVEPLLAEAELHLRELREAIETKRWFEDQGGLPAYERHLQGQGKAIREGWDFPANREKA